jgi:hypothetical protein
MYLYNYFVGLSSVNSSFHLLEQFLSAECCVTVPTRKEMM